MPFQYTIRVSPGPIDQEVANTWAKRLSDSYTIQKIKDGIAQLDWREVLMRAAEGYADLFGSTNDPRIAAAVLKHRAALGAVDADAAKQKLISVLDSGEYAQRVEARKDRYAVKTSIVLPAARATGQFVNEVVMWLREKIDPAAYYFAGAISASTMYAVALGLLFAKAAGDAIPEADAENFVAQLAGDMKHVLDVVLQGKSQAQISVDIDPNTDTLTIEVNIPDPQSGGTGNP